MNVLVELIDNRIDSNKIENLLIGDGARYDLESSPLRNKLKEKLIVLLGRS